MTPAANRRRNFAVIPAAGHSRRMGRPKLLLPWGDRTVIETVLAAWRASRVDAVVVVVRAADAPLLEVVRAACAAGGAGAELRLVAADPPPAEMKDSVAAGLRYLADHFHPADGDTWLMAPADVPGLTTERIDEVLAAHQARCCERDDDSITVAAHEGHRGHPAAFPWSLAGEVFRLGPEDSVRTLFDRHTAVLCECTGGPEPADLDTPADYDRLVDSADPTESPRDA